MEVKEQGKEFQTLAAATGKALPPRVGRRNRGWITLAEEADRRQGRF